MRIYPHKGSLSTTCVVWAVRCSCAVSALHVLMKQSRFLLSEQEALLSSILSRGIRELCAVLSHWNRCSWKLRGYLHEESWSSSCLTYSCGYTCVHTNTLRSTVTLNGEARMARRGNDGCLKGAEGSVGNRCSGSNQPKDYYPTMRSRLLHHPSFNRHRLPNGAHADFRED